MALDELAATIATINQRINEHRTSLAANETRTRQVLIDPLLAALGWDVTDPNQIELEYDVRGRRADYALLVNSNPVAAIEAKRFGHQLVDDNTMQVMNYANTAGIEYMVVTNGDEWKMYSVFERGAIEERVIMELTVTGFEPHVTALKSLTMWRANLGTSGAPTEASEPVIKSPPDFQTPMSNPVEIRDSNAGKQRPADRTQSNDQITVNQNGEGWYSVADKAFSPAHKRAVKYRLEGNEFNTKNFTDAFVEIAAWLVRSNLLNANHCPIKSTPRGAKYVIAPEPIHENGNVFKSARELPNGLIMEVHSSSEDKLDMLRKILQLSGVSGNSVQIKWE